MRMHVFQAAARRHSLGLALVELMVYLALLALVMALAFRAFYLAMTHHRHLLWTLHSAQLALNVGERWREEIRNAPAGPVLEQTQPWPVWRLSQTNGAIYYAWHDETLLRRTTTQTNWVPVLQGVVAVQMQTESRPLGPVCRLDLELKSYRPTPRFRPVFSFLAVPQTSSKP